MQDLSNTQFFQINLDTANSPKRILEHVYKAMEEKGYNPVSQIVGYMRDDEIPAAVAEAYHRNRARNGDLYRRGEHLIDGDAVERDELVEELLKEYIRNRSWEDEKD